MYAVSQTTDDTLYPLENRLYQRFAFNSPIELRHFNCESDIKATLLNYSKNGLCLRSSVRLNAGSIVMVRVPEDALTNEPQKYEEGFRSVAVAEVKWCQEMAGKNETFFKAGIQYYK